MSGIIETTNIQTENIKHTNGTTAATVGSSGELTVNGAFTSQGIDDNADATAITIDSNERVAVGHSTTGGANFAVCDGANSSIQIFAEVATDTNLIQHYDQTTTAYMNAQYSGATHQFFIGTSESMRIDSGGRVLVGLTSSNSSGESLQLYRNGGVVFSVARQQDGTLVHFRTGSVDGSTHGSIDISGVTCSYNAFSGSHWSRLSDNSKPTILKGTVIETIDEMCDWYRAEFTVPATDEEDEYTMSEPIGLPSGKSVGDTITHTYKGTDYTATITKEGDEKHVKCKISDTEDSKKVYGVHRSWDSDDDTVNDMYVTAVGTHVVRVNKDVTVQAGDLLSSNGDGTAKVQDDDIIRSKTIGKVLTNIKQETYDDGSYTVPCALYCG